MSNTNPSNFCGTQVRPDPRTNENKRTHLENGVHKRQNLIESQEDGNAEHQREAGMVLSNHAPEATFRNPTGYQITTPGQKTVGVSYPGKIAKAVQGDLNEIIEAAVNAIPTSIADAEGKRGPKNHLETFASQITNSDVRAPKVCVGPASQIACEKDGRKRSYEDSCSPDYSEGPTVSPCKRRKASNTQSHIPHANISPKTSPPLHPLPSQGILAVEETRVSSVQEFITKAMETSARENNHEPKDQKACDAVDVSNSGLSGPLDRHLPSQVPFHPVSQTRCMEPDALKNPRVVLPLPPSPLISTYRHDNASIAPSRNFVRDPFGNKNGEEWNEKGHGDIPAAAGNTTPGVWIQTSLTQQSVGRGLALMDVPHDAQVPLIVEQNCRNNPVVQEVPTKAVPNISCARPTGPMAVNVSHQPLLEGVEEENENGNTLASRLLHNPKNFRQSKGDESEQEVASRSHRRGKHYKCTLCGEFGHNRRTCIRRKAIEGYQGSTENHMMLTQPEYNDSSAHIGRGSEYKGTADRNSIHEPAPEEEDFRSSFRIHQYTMNNSENVTISSLHGLRQMLIDCERQEAVEVVEDCLRNMEEIRRNRFEYEDTIARFLKNA